MSVLEHGARSTAWPGMSLGSSVPIRIFFHGNFVSPLHVAINYDEEERAGGGGLMVGADRGIRVARCYLAGRHPWCSGDCFPPG